MKVVYPICCGVDVHKKFLIGTIITTTKGIEPKYQKKRFSTHNGDINRFADWLKEHNCSDICMESTGKYWIPVYNILEEKGINVTIANPKWVSVVKGNKDDVKDSKWIGDLFRLGLVPGSFIPPKEFRVLRELTRYRSKLVSMKSSEKNRFQNAFTVCNVSLDHVVSDMFGKSASLITDYLLKTEKPDSEYCKTLLKGSLKKKADTIAESVEGCMFTQQQKARILLVQDHLEYIEKQIKNIDAIISTILSNYLGIIGLLTTIPGLDYNSAITIISEIGVDMSQFGSSKRLCCWAGLTPGNNESAGKKKSVRIMRAGVYLKPALVEVAHAAVKSTVSPYYKNKYERISQRRGKKRAIIAIARMILTAIFSIISNNSPWKPSDLSSIDMPDALRQKIIASKTKQAISFLTKQGFTVSP